MPISIYSSTFWFFFVEHLFDADTLLHAEDEARNCP